MIDLCEEDLLKTTELWKNESMEKYTNVKRVTLETVNVWANLRLRVCVFYPKTREIKASICSD